MNPNGQQRIPDNTGSSMVLYCTWPFISLGLGNHSNKMRETIEFANLDRIY
jgi:hypothetical protein